MPRASLEVLESCNRPPRRMPSGRLARSVALLLLCCGFCARLEAQPVEIASIDLRQTDFSDLEPLARAIGEARLVLLGEATHGDGSAFRAKARLVRFLHERLGFDVLAFEAGLFDMDLVDAALREGSDLRVAAERGLYSMWAHSSEVLDLLEAVRAAHSSGRQLTVAGFDARISTAAARERLAADAVYETLARLEPGSLQESDRAELRRFFANLVPREYYLRPGPRAHDRRLVERLHALARRHLEGPRPPRELAWIAQTLETSLRLERWLESFDAEGRAALDDNRERMMADNLLWLLHRRFAGRKIVAWTHNYHAMAALYLCTTPQQCAEADARPPGPMGRFLRQELGQQLYTLGLLAYGGSFGAAGEEPEPLPPTPPDSIESLLHAAGHRIAFVDLRALPAGHELRQYRPARFYFHEPATTDWARVYDGLLYLDEMHPSVPLPAARPGPPPASAASGN
jgi:erythromycin esterase